MLTGQHVGISVVEETLEEVVGLLRWEPAGGAKIATIAIARKLLTRAYHLLAAQARSATPPAASATCSQAGHPPAGRVTKPRARSLLRHEPAAGRARSSD